MAQPRLGLDQGELSVADTVYCFVNSHLVENRENMSHIPLQTECRHGSLFSPTGPGRRSGQGPPTETQPEVSAVEEGYSSGVFSPKVPGPSGEPRQRGFPARTVPPCGLALFLAPQHAASRTPGPAQKFCEPSNILSYIPFCLK